MAEPTQGNPTPPNNQDGITPPMSNDVATKAFDKFFAEMEDLKKTIEGSKKILETQKKLQADLNKASLIEQKARNAVTEGMKKLDKENEKYRDKQGNWLAETEAMQAKYAADMEELHKAHLETEDSFFKASDALMENTKAMGQMKDATQSALFGLRDLRDMVREFDPEVAAGLSKAYGEAANLVVNSNKDFDAANSEIARTSGEELEKALGEMADGLRKANNAEMHEEAIKAQEKIFDAQKEFAEQTKKLADEMSTTEIAQELGAGGGVVGLRDIKAEVDDLSGLTDKAVALYKAKNKEATDSDVKKYKEEFIYQQKSLIQQRLEQKFNKEIDEQRNKRILKIMEEKKVSKDVAAKIDSGSKEGKQADADMIKRHEDTMKGFESLNATQLAMLENAKDSDMKLAEKEAEAANDYPPWAQPLIDGIASLKDTMGGMFKKEDGWFKTILLILSVTIGAVLGYIFYKVMFIFNIVKGIFGLLTHLPFGIGKAIGGVFAKLGGVGGGIAKMFSGVGSKLGLFGEGIAKIFPFIGRLGTAFKFGFQILGKAFFYIQLVVDAIFGAYKGFQQLGNIKGLIMGAIAQIISGLTFGLLDFQSIFDFFNTTMSGVFDGIAGVFEPLIDYISTVYENATAAFTKIFAIFQGEGSIFSKIMKAIWVGVSTMLKNAVAAIIFAVKTIINTVIVLPYKIGVFIREMLIKLAELTYDAFMSLWDWIASGEILADVANFGKWLYDEMVAFFGDILGMITDAIPSVSDIPGVGWVTSWFSDDEDEGFLEAVEKGAVVIDNAQQTTTAMAKNAGSVSGTGAVQFSDAPITPIATPSGKVQFAAPSYNANTVNTATMNTATARMEATNQGGTAVINTPTTNNVMSGGGGESNVLMPTNNRNTEPTFRALLFQDCPAL